VARALAIAESSSRSSRGSASADHGGGATSRLEARGCLSTKCARQFTEEYTHDSRFVVEVSEIRNEMMIKHKI
jgi:hypothetical protein